MKKIAALVLLLIALTFIVEAQDFYFNPVISITRIDTTGIKLARQLAGKIVDGRNQNKFPVSGKIDTGVEGLKQRFAVFYYNGKVFSVYYQWEANKGAISLYNCDFLAIYVRPEGTNNPRSLVSYKDYHLNGTWDEYNQGDRFFLAEYEYRQKIDPEIQKDFLEAIKEALGFFK